MGGKRTPRSSGFMSATAMRAAARTATGPGAASATRVPPVNAQQQRDAARLARVRRAALEQTRSGRTTPQQNAATNHPSNAPVAAAAAGAASMPSSHRQRQEHHGGGEEEATEEEEEEDVEEEEGSSRGVDEQGQGEERLPRSHSNSRIGTKNTRLPPVSAASTQARQDPSSTGGNGSRRRMQSVSLPGARSLGTSASVPDVRRSGAATERIQRSSGGGRPSTSAARRGGRGVSSAPRRSVVELPWWRGTEFERAADALLRADFFLISAGAGFSADSGLPVYKDIADLPAYKRRGLDYADLCDPMWLTKDAETFYGFWGSCFNMYHDTDPHEGYVMLRKWAVRLFGKAEAPGATAEEVQTLTDAQQVPFPRNVFVYTSNVDRAFVRMGFPEEQVYEIHGNVRTWQCSWRCHHQTWMLDAEHRFHLNETTMRAPRRRPPKKVQQDGGDDDDDDNDEGQQQVVPSGTPASSNSISNSNSNSNSNSVASNDSNSSGSDATTLAPETTETEENFIKCAKCHTIARPNILMFDDEDWIEVDSDAYDNWRKRVARLRKRDYRKSIVILELGCGIRIPTVRQESTSLLKKHGHSATLIRVNPDYPQHKTMPGRTVSIQMGALEALRKIEEVLEAKGWAPPPSRRAAAASASAARPGTAGASRR